MLILVVDTTVTQFCELFYPLTPSHSHTLVPSHTLSHTLFHGYVDTTVTQFCELFGVVIGLRILCRW